jgi:hypothetical protein
VANLAQAQVFQTDAAKTPLPQPVGPAEFNLVTESWGWNAMTQSYKDPMTGAQLNTPIVYGQYYSPPAYPQFVDGDAITLQGMFKWRGENIDPVKDAKTAPGYFSPACGFTGQLLLMGGNCDVSFGWYNVDDPNSTTPPAAADIHEIIPSDPTYLNCLDENGGPKTDGFCPKGWDNRSPRNLSIKVWTPKAFDSGNIKSDPNYHGKYVGFAVIGNPATACTQNKYSMYAYNQKNSQGVPWVTTLIYQSTVDPEGFYMAFEDLPMSAADWHQTGVPGNQGSCDGDFNDFVFYVSGISCVGGNQPCDTGLKGACAVGHTDCQIGTEPPACRPVIQPGVEICDNVDNDCDGVIDNGEGLCPDPDKPICFQGSCVGTCTGGEFPCPGGTACDATGHCVDPTCASINCAAGTACRNGACVDPCGGVVCPSGFECELGQCVDPCAGVTCTAGRVCDKGLCVADCSCSGCTTGLTCGSDGKCADTACASVSCANGTVCKLGTCVDPCAGVVCPGGGVCTKGTCSAPGTGGGSSVGQDGGISFGGSGIDFGGTTSSGASSGTGRPSLSAVTQKGCGCRIGQTESERSSARTLAWLASALGLGVTSLARRRRSKRAA